MIKLNGLQAESIEVKDSSGNEICSIMDGNVGVSPNYIVYINGAKYDDEEETNKLTIKGQDGAYVSALLAASPKRMRDLMSKKRAILLASDDDDLSNDDKMIKKYLTEFYTEDGRRLLHAGD